MRCRLLRGRAEPACPKAQVYVPLLGALPRRALLCSLHLCPSETCFVFLIAMHQIMTGHEECVQMLLEQEVSILCKDSRGRTPLHYAAARGHATWLSELLQMALSEEDCSFKDNQGYTPLHWACYNGELILFD